MKILRALLIFSGVIPLLPWKCSGTTQGDIFIMNSTSMRIQQAIRKAHLGFVTAMRFSPDSRSGTTFWTNDFYSVIFTYNFTVLDTDVWKHSTSQYRVLASASLDSSARVTLIQEEKHKGRCFTVPSFTVLLFCFSPIREGFPTIARIVKHL